MASKKIFISYSRRDLDFVTRLVDGLRKEGETVWFDSHIRSGDQWDDAIEREIRHADILVVVLSDTSVSSGNVMDEVSLAKDLDKTIIPIMIRECDLPMRLRRYQYIDFVNNGVEWGFQRLLHDIREDSGKRQPPLRPKPRPKTTKKSRNWVPFLVGGVVFVVFFSIIGLLTEEDGMETDAYNDNFLEEDYDPVDSNTDFAKTGMVIYQNATGQVTVNKTGGGYPQVGDVLYAITPLEVYTHERYANGDYIATGSELEVVQIYPMTADGFIFMDVRY